MIDGSESLLFYPAEQKYCLRPLHSRPHLLYILSYFLPSLKQLTEKIIIVICVIGVEIDAIRLIPLKYICTRKRRQYTVSDREQAYVVDSHILTERCLLFCCSAKHDLW